MSRPPGFVFIDEWETFPDVEWLIEIRSMPVQKLDGHNILPKSYGCFFRIPAQGGQEPRLLFWPWSAINRLYQVGKGQ